MPRTTSATLTAAAAALTLLGSALLSSPASARPSPASARPTFPDVIALPDGFRPEGITSGRATTFYVGSLADGAVYHGDARTGEGEVFVAGTTGDTAVGTEVDQRNRLWVAGGSTGEARVYDARTGELLREYQLAAPGTGLVNDVVVTREAAYFTDSVNAVLYVVPLANGGRPGAARALPLTGDLVYQPGFNANGIEASPNGRTLLVVQSNTGNLYAVDAATGVAEQVDLGGASLTTVTVCFARAGPCTWCATSSTRSPSWSSAAATGPEPSPGR